MLGQGYEGHVPRVNASRAPGLWQTLHIRFCAPRFDASGAKVEDARFELVVLNGAVLHQDVTVSGPTRAAAFTDEAPMGPLMIQGDHGPVAFRNVRYKRYDARRLETSGVRYRIEVSNPGAASDNALSVQEGELPALAAHTIQEADPLKIEYAGTLHVPAAGLHRFSVALDWITGDPHFEDQCIGGAALVIDGTEVLRHDANMNEVASSATLEAGAHPFSFTFHKTVGWRPPSVTLIVEGPTSPPHRLTAAPPRRTSPVIILVEAGPSSTILRGFVEHEGITYTHAVSVATPSGVHYNLDLATGAVLHMWRGPFLNAAGMWHNRGHDQLVQPLGSVLT